MLIHEKNEVSKTWATAIDREEALRPISQARGFSLVELLIVLAVMLIIVAFAIPTVSTTVDTYRLRGTMGSTSNLLQRCRMQAAKQNVTQQMHFMTDAATKRVVVFVTPATDTISSTTQIKTDRNVLEQYWFPAQFALSGAPTGAGAPSALTGNSMWGTSINVTNISQDFYFNSRGMPCDYNAANGSCSGTNGFIYYYKYTSGKSTRWVATSLSPAGRIQSWFYDGGKWGN